MMVTFCRISSRHIQHNRAAVSRQNHLFLFGLHRQPDEFGKKLAGIEYFQQDELPCRREMGNDGIYLLGVRDRSLG
jgi:hypothetical protein